MTLRRNREAPRWAPKKVLAALTAAVVGIGLAPVALATPAFAQSPTGQGFNLNAGDLDFILRQIRIAERHSATRANADPTNPNPDLCAGLRGPGPDQIPLGNNADTLPWGLRTVDGTCNNLVSGRTTFGAADIVFPRKVAGSFRAAEPGDPDGPTGPAVEGPTTYAQRRGVVFDSQPRVISNLIVDQTAGNPAAVAVAGTDVAGPGENDTLFIPNVATDTGLSAPFNALFTLFGQFFDHGLDLVSKSGGSVFVPLRADDPLIPGPDGQLGTGDDLPERQRFMVLTRATNQPGPDGIAGDNPATPADESADDIQEAKNTTTPFVDQNQTYTSHPSHQVFVREYALDTAGDPVPTGRLITSTAGMGTWQGVKAQAATLLGIRLVDTDVFNVPLLATDPYGRFAPGPNGFPQIVTATGLVEGNPAGGGVAVPANALRTGHAFLDDIAHHAVPAGRNGPLAPDGDPGVTDDRDATTYDDEMLNAHFIAGDGRVNENIGLTAVHHVFHAEHNRLTDDINAMLTDPANAARLAEWQAAGPSGWGYGERLFQASRFVTEMEYQHLVFEEFGRKVQPLINLFGAGGTGYNTTTNPAISAEFAHAVYRFGHSMLNETVARTGPGGQNLDIGLIQAFLNPQEFTQNGTLSAEAGAGNIIRGTTRQIGNEIDEFVTEALRNNLLGLPLDLAVLNIARARETGSPTLNAARAQFFAETGDADLAPYTSWADFSFNLKNRDSLVNFIAAYGRHPSITGVTTLADKRAAARLIVADDQTAVPASPVDSGDFMNSTGTWAAAGATGLNDVDLWMGGLAERRNVFGGLLGSTFNYVFELQLENLQFGDRFYYLSRTAGLNLLTQLEGNSLAEIISRNTDASGLPADVFSRPDYVFNVAALGTSGPIPDDPSTPYNESTIPELIRDGTGFRYTGPAHVVFNGRDDAANGDRLTASEGDDTIRGNAGNDRIEGGDGVDNVIGGDGDDIITDKFGDDVLKGGAGNDAIQSGKGFAGDLNQSGTGNDFVYGGLDAAETFAGPGDDFVFAGTGDDTVFGDDGNDWIEGGAGAFNLLQGDLGNPFADDPNGGHDVLDGDGGEQDFDSEGGDDIMLMGQGIQRSEGMLGFDWGTHKGDQLAADSDLSFTGLLPPAQETLKDRFDLVEALSGANFDDILRGDSRVAADIVAPGDQPINSGHALTQEGINRISGLQELLGAGVTSYNAGNIIIGGAGSDVIEGRGGDDRIDGDRWLNVRISVRNAAGVEIQTANSMSELQAQVFAGTINPGQLQIVREILPTTGAATDTAVFSGASTEYDVTTDPATGVMTVVHARGTQVDGTDTLTGIERLQFTDGAPVFAAPGAPVIGNATAGDASATVRWTAPPAANPAVSSYEVDVRTGTTVVRTVNDVAATATSTVVGGLTNGTAYNFVVRAVNSIGTGPGSAASNEVTPAGVTAPGAPTIGTATAGNGQATVNWTAPASNGGSAITGYEIEVRSGGVAQRTVASTGTAVTATVTGLTNGTAYNFRVRAINGVGPGAYSAISNTVTPAGVAPGAPTAVTATAGNTSAQVSWTAPASDGGSPITGYQVDVRTGTTLVRTVTTGNATTLTVTGLTNGTAYNFVVRAVNAAGTSVNSTASNTVTPVGTPSAPAIGTASAGNASATVRWTAPTSNGGSAITSYQILVNTGGTTVRTVTGIAATATSSVVDSLTNGTSYTFQVRAVNAVGTGPNSAQSNAVTPVADSTAPTVTGRAPAAGATGVAVGTNVTATFSEPVNGVSGTTFTLRVGTSTTGTQVAAAVSYDAATRTAVLNPTNDLAANTQYTARLLTGITDTAGNPLAPVTWSFTTGAANTAPTVTSRSPGINATGVFRTQNVVVGFSESIIGQSTTTVTLTNVSTGALVTSTVSPATGSATSVTLDPGSTLLANTQYRVNLVGGASAIRDLAGAPLASQSWTFTTGAF